MITSYIKTSARSIIRNRLFSAINIFGLAISMSVGLLVISILYDLLSFDSFHTNADRIYRVTTIRENIDGTRLDLASSSAFVGKALANEFTGIAATTQLRRGFGGDAEIGEKKIPVSGIWGDKDFFKVFSFELVEGDASRALREPNSTVLTASAAKRLFGAEKSVGKSLKIETTLYTVTGVIRDLPVLTHFRFEVIASYANVELQKPDFDGDFMAWENFYMNYNYILIDENTDVTSVQAQLDKLSGRHKEDLKESTIRLSLQELRDISAGAKLANQLGPYLNPFAIWILVGLAAVVILSACFNYTNLSVARSLRRTKEIGIRKVIGAASHHVLGQFLAEAIIVAMISLAFGLVIFFMLRQQFLGLHPFISSMFELKVNIPLVAWFIVLAGFVGLMAGALPAIYFSRLNAARVLKDSGSTRLFHRVNMRKGLIVVQYVFSLTFIAITIIGYQQYKGFLGFDLGFATKNILNIELQGNNPEILKKELLELPLVKDVSGSAIVTSIGNIYGTTIRYTPDDSASVWLNLVDERYIPLHEHKLLAGTNFQIVGDSRKETEVIVNEQILKRFNIRNAEPSRAIGEQLVVDGKKLTIIGVVKDFHYGTMEEKIEPMIFRYTPQPGGFVNVLVEASDVKRTLEAVDQVWKKVDRVHPIKAKFYDDQIAEAYSQFSLMVRVIGFLAFLSICIASLGMFGMVVFTTETKMKEISIRKVLGAGEARLVVQLSKGFLFLLALAALIALPATYVFFENVVLTNFAYHQPIAMSGIAITLTIVMGLGLIMIVSQTLKAARTNPADVLKVE